MNRSLAALLFCATLTFGLACGKYGRPERVAPSEPVVSAAVADVSDLSSDDAALDDKKKSPKR